MAPIREHYQDELDHLVELFSGGMDLVIEAVDRTVEACEGHDLELAQEVVGGDDRIDARYIELQHEILAILARQAPVATDLRLIAALLHASKSMERMGDQCVNVAKLLPVAPHPPEGESLTAKLVQMGRQVHTQLVNAKRALVERDLTLARDLVRQDDVVDRLNRDCFGAAVDMGGDHDAREWAMAMTMAARAFERMGDSTVDIGEQVAFIVTGEIEEFEDASHPENGPVPA
jgi:phosphate transport system protein